MNVIDDDKLEASGKRLLDQLQTIIDEASTKATLDLKGLIGVAADSSKNLIVDVSKSLEEVTSKFTLDLQSVLDGLDGWTLTIRLNKPSF